MPGEVTAKVSTDECCPLEALMGIVFVGAFLAGAGYAVFWLLTSATQGLALSGFAF